MTQNKKEQWLKKFDEEFPHEVNCCFEAYGTLKKITGMTPDVCSCPIARRFAKSSLSSLIDDIDLDWEKRILEAVGKEKEQLDKNDPDNYGACYAIAGFNDCRSQILEKLELKEK